MVVMIIIMVVIIIIMVVIIIIIIPGNKLGQISLFGHQETIIMVVNILMI